MLLLGCLPRLFDRVCVIIRFIASALSKIYKIRRYKMIENLTRDQRQFILDGPRAATTTTASGVGLLAVCLDGFDQICGCASLKDKRSESSELDDYEAWT